MRIALIHSYYRSSQPSGENTAVDLQAEALAARGHQVLLVSASSDDIEMRLGRLASLGIQVALRRGRNPWQEVSDFRADVIHVHNLFPSFGYAWLSKCSTPVVATLHNFRSLCANGLLFRDGHKCYECPEGSSLAAVKHGCYRDSRLATLPLALRNLSGVAKDPLVTRADRLIVLAQSARRIFAHYGVPKDRMTVVFQGMNASTVSGQGPRRGFLCAGRLTAEKGVSTLASHWPDDLDRLTIVGSGPERRAVDAVADQKQSVEVVGSLPRAELLQRLPTYRGVLIPSLCHEMLPYALVEALSRGVPYLHLKGMLQLTSFENSGAASVM